MIRLATATSIFLLAWTECHALDLMCSEFRPMLQDRQLERPKMPDCASTTYPFSDSYEFDNCKTQVEDYRSKLNSYLSCLRSESADAIAEYNDLVAAFNRRAQQ